MRVMVINGPNLNLLGQREPGVYGSDTLADINGRLEEVAAGLGQELVFAQSNHEGALVDAIQEAGRACAGAVLNAGGYTHTSVAVRDAVAGVGVPVVEVHISNPAAREPFRHVSLLSGVCAGSIAGFGWRGYELALLWLARQARES